MRVRYVTALARERAAWREFVAAGAGTSDSERAYQRWQAAAQRMEAIAIDLQHAGLAPPEGLFVASTSLMRPSGRLGGDARNDPDAFIACDPD